MAKKGEGERRRHHFSSSVSAEDTLQVGAAGTPIPQADELSSALSLTQSQGLDQPDPQPRLYQLCSLGDVKQQLGTARDGSLCSQPAQHHEQLTGNKSLSKPVSPQGPQPLQSLCCDTGLHWEQDPHGDETASAGTCCTPVLLGFSSTKSCSQLPSSDG